MFVPTRTPHGPHLGGATISVNIGHPDFDRAACLIEAAGGTRRPLESGVVYTFRTRSSRDHALDLARKRFGWAVARPYESLAETLELSTRTSH